MGGDYLGITAGFLVEIRQTVPEVRNLIPENVKFSPSKKAPYRGVKSLTLTNYSNTSLIMIKSCRSRDGSLLAQLYLYKNNGRETDRETLSLVRLLASYRWPEGVLMIKKQDFRGMSSNFALVLQESGWEDLRKQPGVQAFRIKLPKPKLV